MALEPINYKALDPGVQGLVRLLRSNGFETTDSGDGVSKCEHGRVLDILHVFMVVAPEKLISQAHYLHEKLDIFEKCASCELIVEASYRPEDGMGILMLMEKQK